MQKYTKFANFTWLYFPHFTIFCDQTLQFFCCGVPALVAKLNKYINSGDGIRSSCLGENLVYGWNGLFRLSINVLRTKVTFFDL